MSKNEYQFFEEQVLFSQEHAEVAEMEHSVRLRVCTENSFSGDLKFGTKILQNYVNSV